jgi:hypothetical protein
MQASTRPRGRLVTRLPLRQWRRTREPLPCCALSFTASPRVAAQELQGEVALRRDTIYLEGGARAVEESRLTGWQSDIGATFCYSGKDMAPQPGGLSPAVRKVSTAPGPTHGCRRDAILPLSRTPQQASEGREAP